jgi:TrmH family RNA methyltransferase
MKTISSRQNALFKRVHDAVREHGEEIVIEGPKAIADARAAGWRALLVVGEDVVFSDALLNDVTDTKTSQGMLALFARPRATLRDLFARADTVVVALDGVQDPGNVGAIVRLAAAFDAAGIALLPGCADPFGPKAIRASAGAILNVACANATHDELRAIGWPLVAADARGQAADPPARGAILAFGSEGSGVSEALARAARKIAIPMSNRVESLNVAAAAAILLSRSYALRVPSPGPSGHPLPLSRERATQRSGG